MCIEPFPSVIVRKVKTDYKITYSLMSNLFINFDEMDLSSNLAMDDLVGAFLYRRHQSILKKENHQSVYIDFT